MNTVSFSASDRRSRQCTVFRTGVLFVLILHMVQNITPSYSLLSSSLLARNHLSVALNQWCGRSRWRPSPTKTNTVVSSKVVDIEASSTLIENEARGTEWSFIFSGSSGDLKKHLHHRIEQTELSKLGVSDRAGHRNLIKTNGSTSSGSSSPNFC